MPDLRKRHRDDAAPNNGVSKICDYAKVLEDFTLETFAGRLGETFRVDDDSGVVDLRLASAEAGNDRPAKPEERTPFSIVFVGPREPILPQRIYRFAHEGLGTFELFIVPIGPDESGMQYEAVFA